MFKPVHVNTANHNVHKIGDVATNVMPKIRSAIQRRFDAAQRPNFKISDCYRINLDGGSILTLAKARAAIATLRAHALIHSHSS